MIISNLVENYCMVKNYISLITLFCTFFLTAQNIVIIEWGFGSNSSVDETAANFPNKTIEVGSTIRWVFVGSGSHNVVSSSGSQESFNSGSLQGAGFEFEYTFTQIGENPYVCSPHASTMNGTITVVAQGTLSTQNFDKTKVRLYVNSIQNYIQLRSDLDLTSASVSVIDLTGRSVLKSTLKSTNDKIDISSLKTGLYFSRINLDGKIKSMRFVKE